MKIDKSKPVLVTGANGYVASWLVKRLLEKGITVHAAVRNPANKEKVAHLEQMAQELKGSIKYFDGDLLKPNAYKEAMQDCELVYHTASPFALDVSDAQKELIEPAVKGTENVLNSANEIDSVKRVVLTSSCAAIYTDAIDTINTPHGQITEEDWNTTASLEYQPYSYSKTLAEQKAWEMAKDQNKWDLVTINPSLVLGPALNAKMATSESMKILQTLGNGDMKMGAPKVGIGIVDVRDVADAHFEAGYNSDAKGRYITSAYNTNFLEMGQSLLAKFGKDYPLPKRALPKWLALLVGPIVNKQLSRKYIKNNVNVPFRADNSKIKSELGIQFKPMIETMEESFQAIVEAELLSS